MYTASDVFVGTDTFAQAQQKMARQPFVLPYFAYAVDGTKELPNLRKGKWEGRAKNYPMVPPLVWETTNTSERTAYFEMNAFRPILSALAYMFADGVPEGPLDSDERIMLDLVLDWAQHGFFDAETFVPSRIVFRWYDMAVGCRVSVLVYFLQRLARQDDESSLEAFTLLAQHLHAHYIALIDEQYWVKHSNHGLFQAIGLYNIALCIHVYKHRETAMQTAIERIRYFFQQGYSIDGFWLEHSPGYHKTIHDIIQPLCDTAALPSPFALYMKKLYLRSLHALSWFVQPDRTLAPIGDTPLAPIIPEHPVAHLGYDGHYTSQEAGYAFYRNNIANPDKSTYFCFCASFHANVHKHLDDLSFIWWSRGIPLAVDSGMFMLNGAAPDKERQRMGFRYNDPMRMYVESNRAHNTIEIDEKPDFRQKANFYGSAILNSAMVDEYTFSVSGRVSRHSQFVHTRHMLIHDDWLLIADSVKRKKGAAASDHTFDQWFSLHPDLIPAKTQNPHAVSFETTKGIVHVHSLTKAEPSVFCGQTEPFLAGWYCPQCDALPTHSLRYRQKGGGAIMVTLLTFDTVTQAQVIEKPDESLYVQWETPLKSISQIFPAMS